MILLKKWAKHKVKSYTYCGNQFLREKRHKKWNEKVNKNSLFCSIVIFLISRTQKIAWWPLFLNLIFTYFPKTNNSRKFKEI